MKKFLTVTALLLCQYATSAILTDGEMYYIQIINDSAENCRLVDSKLNEGEEIIGILPQRLLSGDSKTISVVAGIGSARLTLNLDCGGNNLIFESIESANGTVSGNIVYQDSLTLNHEKIQDASLTFAIPGKSRWHIR